MPPTAGCPLRGAPVPLPSRGGSASTAGPCPQVIFLPALCINQILLQARGERDGKPVLHSFSNCNIFSAPPWLFPAALQAEKQSCTASRSRNPKLCGGFGAAWLPIGCCPVAFTHTVPLRGPDGVAGRMLPAMPRG